MKSTVACFLLLISVISAIAQDEQLWYTEKISLITDRDLYISGENIWFRADCTARPGNPDSIISRIIYIELYDQKFNSISRSKYMIHNGVAAGHVEIPSDINTGNYFVRAYTQYSRNFHSYMSPITMVCVINPQRPLAGDESVREDEIMIVPSGGRLVKGIPSETAIRLTPALCKRNPTIYLKDVSGNEIQRVTPLKNGLAVVEFTPETKKYFLVVKDSLGKEIRRPMPEISETGVVLKTGLLGTSIKAGLNSADENTGDYEIEVRSFSGDFLNKRSIKPGNTLIIPVENHKKEMVYTVLKQNDSILDVQPVYIRENSGGTIHVHPEKPTVMPREQISILIDSPPALTDQFIFVVSRDALLDEPDILPWFIPYNPSLLVNYLYHTPDISDSLLRQIETTMILYADFFRKQDFKKWLENRSELQWLPEIRDAGISGRVVDRITRRPLENVEVFASVVNENNQIHVYKTDDQGKFYFTLNHLAGTHHVYLNAKPADSLNLELLVNSDFDNTYPESAGIIPFIPDTTFIDRLNRIILNARLTGIYPKYAPSVNKKVLYRPVPKPEQLHTVMLADYIEMPVMSEVFSEIVPFTTVKRKDNRYFFQVFDNTLGATYYEPLVLVDGIPTFNVNQIMEVDPVQIKKIEVTNATVFMGNYSVDGIISITSHQKNFAGIILPETSRFIEFQGISNESYPAFSDLSSNQVDRNPDFRTLVSWSKLIRGQKKVSFTTPDNPGDYQVIICGTDGKKQYRGKTSFKITGNILTESEGPVRVIP